MYDDDIISFDGVDFSMVFDASDVGLSADIDAFEIVNANTILMSFTSSEVVSGVGTVDDYDIVQFNATSLGENTAGSFSLYFDGEDVGLDSTKEDIDAFDLLSDGRLLISTSGSYVVPNLSGKDEDLLAFTPTSLGENTSGDWEIYFDGSDVGLSDGGPEDSDGVSVAANGDIYLTTRGSFSVTDVTGDSLDIFLCSPASLGAITACTYSPTLYFDGSIWGLSSNNLDGFDLP